MLSIHTSTGSKPGENTNGRHGQDFLSDVERKTLQILQGNARPSDLLRLKYLNVGCIFLFERYLQAVLTVFKSGLAVPTDWENLKTYINLQHKIKSNEANTRRLVFRTLMASMNDLAPEGYFNLNDAQVRSLKRNRGCIEVNPLEPLASNRTIGNSATFVAFRDTYTGSEFIPLFLGGPISIRGFRDRIQMMLKDRFSAYFPTKRINNKDPEDLGTMISELYSNMILHAMPARKKDEYLHDNHHSEANIRVLRFTGQLFANAQQFTAHYEKHFPQFRSVKQYGQKLRDQYPSGGIRIVTLSIFDNGPGILNHYQNVKGRDQTNLEGAQLFDSILTTQLSSSAKPGAGDGIRNALDAVRRLNGFLSVRSGPYWGTASSVDKSLRLFFELDEHSAISMDGTCYTIVLPRSLRQ